MRAGNAGLIHIGEGNLDGIDGVNFQMEKTCASSVLSTILGKLPRAEYEVGFDNTFDTLHTAN